MKKYVKPHIEDLMHKNSGIVPLATALLGRKSVASIMISRIAASYTINLKEVLSK